MASTAPFNACDGRGDGREQIVFYDLEETQHIKKSAKTKEVGLQEQLCKRCYQLQGGERSRDAHRLRDTSHAQTQQEKYLEAMINFMSTWGLPC